MADGHHETGGATTWRRQAKDERGGGVLRSPVQERKGRTAVTATAIAMPPSTNVIPVCPRLRPTFEMLTVSQSARRVQWGLPSACVSWTSGE
jgi:hypothetical protein